MWLKATAANSLELQLKNKINLLNRLGREGGDGGVGRRHGKRRPDKQNLMHSKVIKLPDKTPTDIFKQTRTRKEIESKYSQKRKVGQKGDLE